VTGKAEKLRYVREVHTICAADLGPEEKGFLGNQTDLNLRRWVDFLGMSPPFNPARRFGDNSPTAWARFVGLTGSRLADERSKEGGVLKMRHVRVSPYPEEAGLALPGPPESFGTERMKETAPTEAVGCIIDGGQEAKTEILANGEVSSKNRPSC